MSVERWKERARKAAALGSADADGEPAASPAEMRLSVSFIRGPSAPIAEQEPTSSWSKSATQRTEESEAREGIDSTRAVMPWKHEHWLSSRPEYTNSSSAPPRRLHVDELGSKSSMAAASTLSSSAISLMRRGGCERRPERWRHHSWCSPPKAARSSPTAPFAASSPGWAARGFAERA